MTQPRLPEDLEQFERQLRSLMPRKAACQLNSASDFPVKSNSLKEAGWLAVFRRPAWAAAILLSWALGAAMGTGVTLLFVYPGLSSAPHSNSLAAITEEATPAVVEHSRNMEQQEESETGPADLVSEPRPEAPSERGWLANTPLTAHSRAIDILLLEFQSPGFRSSRPTDLHSQSAGELKRQESVAIPAVPIVPARLVVAPPVRQQELLRDLLATEWTEF